MTVRDDPVREQLMQVGGRRLRVAIRPGTGTGPPLLLCNGVGMRLEALQPFVDALDPAIEVIRFDAPGTGRSQLPSLPYRFTTLALLLRQMLHDLGHQQADVLGISWGGGLAQQFALLNPRRCRRLILVATSTGPQTMVPPNPLPPAKNLILRRWGDLWGGTAKTDPDALARALHKARISPLSTGFWYQHTAALGFTTLPLLPLIRQRTLVLTGDQDPIIPVANGRILAAGIPHATLHVYHGGHVELATRPGLLTPLITSFLATPPHDARRADQAQAAAALRDAREQAAATEGANALRAGEGLTGRDPVTAPDRGSGARSHPAIRLPSQAPGLLRDNCGYRATSPIMAGYHLRERRRVGAARFPGYQATAGTRQIAVPYQNSGSQPAAGTRGPRRDGREGAPAWSVAWTAAATSCAVSASMAMLRRSSMRRTTWPAWRGGSCGRSAMSVLFLEVVVDGGAVHADGDGDLGGGVQPLAVRAGGGVHAADGSRLGGAQLGLAAAGAAAGPGGGQALPGALDDQLPLELIDRAQEMEHEPSLRGGGVDLLLEHDQADAALAQLVGQREQVLEGPHGAGQPGDDEDVAGAQVGQGLVELGAGGVLARGGVGKDLLAAVGFEVVDLAVVVLSAGGYPRVPDLRHHRSPAAVPGGASGRAGRDGLRRHRFAVGSWTAAMPLTVA